MGRGLLSLLLLVTACGGRLETTDGGTPESSSSSGSSSGGGSGSGGNSGSGGGSGGTNDFPVCPADPPTVGTSCSPAGSSQGCAYVGPGTSCQAFVCDASGEWKVAPQGC